MTSIFNYQTISVDLSKPTRTLFITLKEQYFCTQFLFELESVLAWCTNKVEIKTILINSNNNTFSQGIDPKLLQKMDSEKLLSFTTKLQKITYALGCLAQTVICDISKGASNLACELALSCDLRICHEDSFVHFNHNELALVPCSGGISQLTNLMGANTAKNWLLSSLKIETTELKRVGFCFKTYTDETKFEVYNELLNSIMNQADIARIQTKLGINECIREDIEKFNQFETKISKATLISEDYKNHKRSDHMPAKHFSRAVKLSLIKNQDM